SAAAAMTQPVVQAKPAGPCAMVIFGAGGDLTKRLVVPALYNLARTKLIPEHFAVIGVDIADLSTDRWRQNLTQMMQSFTKGGGEFHAAEIDPDAWNSLLSRMTYLRGDFGSDATFKSLGDLLQTEERTKGSAGNVLFYLAVADRFFGPVAEKIAASGLADEQGGKRWRRVIVEKPFGHDLASAKALNARLLKVLTERQIYRIDHFLGKETVQSIMAVRFANGMFEPIWNREHIDHVQITVAETIGVEHRGRFYEQTGALRDMVPNHLFQLLTMTAMEPPSSFDPDTIRSRKTDVLNAIPAIAPACAVRGQYGRGQILGRPVDDYRHEPDVSATSAIETYVALKLDIDTWRWAGVPFYLRTGKRMSKYWTEIAIRFRRAPLSIFKGTDVAEMGWNWLVLQIQPEEGISLQFQVKRPGPIVTLAPVKTSFSYKDWFPPQPNVGYETLIYDCMIGDTTLFQRADMVEGGWRIVQPALDDWARQAPTDFPNYEAGTAGPKAADDLLARDGRAWRPIGSSL
ncbi:MAG TPA: glucose-6-phosphate dehydrogenase, partial [Stellaceae bacterium]|nr:glucose-6-phosphate dehydrogenase [Stellaceae bacterium]